MSYDKNYEPGLNLWISEMSLLISGNVEANESARKEILASRALIKIRQKQNAIYSKGIEHAKKSLTEYKKHYNK